jgi:AraC-like DNA-binding protein
MRSADLNFFRYFPVSERDRQWGLYVTGVGSAHYPAGYAHYPLTPHPAGYMFQWRQGRVLQEFQAVYISQGNGDYESKTVGSREITAGSVILNFPGEWHRYRASHETGWDEYWCSCNGEHLLDLLRQGFFTPQEPILQPGIDDVLLQTYQDLLDLARAEPVGFPQVAAAKVYEILAVALAAVRRRGATSRDENRIRVAKAYLADNVEGPLAIAELAAKLHISPEHLRRLFRHSTGMSPHEYHLELKMHRARQLLHGTNMTVKQIAQALGFESPFHFSRVFKRRTGVPPGHWRRSP